MSHYRDPMSTMSVWMILEHGANSPSNGLATVHLKRCSNVLPYAFPHRVEEATIGVN